MQEQYYLVPEDQEIEGEDSNEESSNSQLTIPQYSSVIKEFNFDYFLNAKLGLVRDHPYDFSGMTQFPPGPGEKHLKDRLYLCKNKIDTIELKRPWFTYFCGCIFYRGKDPGECCLTNAAPNGHSNELKRDEQIYTVTSFINRRLGRTISQRWRLRCWNELEPILRANYDNVRQQRKEIEEQEFLKKHSVIENNEMIPRSTPRGRPDTELYLHLSKEEAKERLNLILRYGKYQYKIRQLLTERANTNTIVKVFTKCNEIYQRVQQLGGVPKNWKEYSNERT